MVKKEGKREKRLWVGSSQLTKLTFVYPKKKELRRSESD